MYKAVRKFLALNHHLALPGIGNFTVEKAPAQIDIANRIIIPPTTLVKFNNEKLPAEKFFYNFLAHELDLDEAQAVRQFTDFTTQLQSDLQDGKPVVLRGIGELRKQTTNVLNFQPGILPQYYPVLIAERVIRKNATHTIRVGEQEKTSDEMQTALHVKEKTVHEEKWWIPAAILAVIGILGIAYYYLVLHPK